MKLVSNKPNDALKKSEERIKNRSWRKISRKIALQILDKMDELGWSQKKLAEHMEVSPQYVNKLVKGKENLTLETLVKLQNILGITLLVAEEQEKHHSTIIKGFVCNAKIEGTINNPVPQTFNFINSKSLTNSIQMSAETKEDLYSYT